MLRDLQRRIEEKPESPRNQGSSLDEIEEEYKQTSQQRVRNPELEIKVGDFYHDMPRLSKLQKLSMFKMREILMFHPRSPTYRANHIEIKTLLNKRQIMNMVIKVILVNESKRSTLCDIRE